MPTLDIAPTERTPGILLDKKNMLFEVKGISRPEDVRQVYNKVVEELNSCLESLVSTQNLNLFKANFKLGYFNSASAKYFADILLLLSSYIKKGCNIRIYWYFVEGDDDMLEAGEEFAEMADIKINYIMISEDNK